MRATLKTAIASLASPLKEAMSEIVALPEFDATLSADIFSTLCQQTGLSDKELRLALLPVAAAYSICPISKFHVGAIARGQSGRLYFGANLEIQGVQLGQTVHAEQSAISHAWIKGETAITDITINYSPCGHCRQFMNELNGAESLMIQLPERDACSLHHYLPEAFGPADLGITEGLLSPINHGLSTAEDTDLITAAVDATNRSHAPYSKNLSGVAIKDTQGRVFSGMYAENAAFNPSLPPLQVALVAMNMAGSKFSNIAEAVLVENGESVVSHLADTQATLEAINPDIPLSYLAL